MTHRDEPDPTAAEVRRAKRELRRAGLGELADNPRELAEVTELLPPVSPAGYLRGLARIVGASTGPPRDDDDQDHAPEPVPVRPGRWVTRASGPDLFIPYDDETLRLAEAVADMPGGIAYDPSMPGDREQALEIMRKFIDMGRRCPACGGLECQGRYAVDLCPSWQEAEARCDRGEYLPTEPGPTYELYGVRISHATEPDRCPVCSCIGHGGTEPSSGSAFCPGALELASDMPACPPEPQLRAAYLGSVESSPDAYTWRPPRAVPVPYGGPHSDPWGRAWCDCGEPLELHAHIPGSITGAWCYAPRDVRRPGERARQLVTVLALVAVGAALGLLALYAIAAGMVLYALSG